MDAAGGTALSREVAGTSFGLFHVWFDACWDAGCVCWHPFIAHTCANWQFSDLHVPVWNLRQIGFPLCEVAQAFLDFPFAFFVRLGFLRPAGGPFGLLGTQLGPFSGRQCRHGFGDFRSQH